jgi:hypothetical protein
VSGEYRGLLRYLDVNERPYQSTPLRGLEGAIGRMSCGRKEGGREEGQACAAQAVKALLEGKLRPFPQFVFGDAQSPSINGFGARGLELARPSPAGLRESERNGASSLRSAGTTSFESAIYVRSAAAASTVALAQPRNVAALRSESNARALCCCLVCGKQQR